MKRFAPFLVLGMVLAVGFPAIAATAVVNLQCSTLGMGFDKQTIIGVTRSGVDVTTPNSCVPGGNSNCAACLADLQNGDCFLCHLRAAAQGRAGAVLWFQLSIVEVKPS